MQDKLIEAEIDDGILGVVLVLNDAGVKTFSSCQGGGYGWGHGYLRPIVCFDGDDSEGERAEKIATDAGYQVFQVQRVWYTRDGERVGPFWEMEFVAGAACRAPKDRAAVRAHDAAKKSAILSDGEDGWILAEFPSMPGCMSQGKGDSDALRNLADAIDAVNAVKAHAAESDSTAQVLTCACCSNETPTLRSVGIMPDMCEPCAKHAESAQLDAEDQHRAVEPVTGEPTAWSAQDHTEEYVKQGYITEQPVEDVVERPVGRSLTLRYSHEPAPTR